MKKCPFCAEEILDDAIKCKHCGEWLNKEKFSLTESSKKLFDSSKKFLKDAKSAYDTQRYKHLYIPTEGIPFVLGDISFSPNKMKLTYRTEDYSNISNIYFYSKVESINGMINDYEVELKIYINVKNNFPIEKRENQQVIDINRSKKFFIGSSRMNREKVQFISKYLHEATLENRLGRYLEFIQDKGFFYYPNGLKIFNNGDVYKNDKKVDNIVDAYQNKRLSYGGQFNSPIGSSYYRNSFTLSLWYTSGKRKYMFFSGSTDIEVRYDRDVFNILLDSLITKNMILDKVETNL